MIAAVFLVCLLAAAGAVVLIIVLARAARRSGPAQPGAGAIDTPGGAATLVIRLPQDRDRCGAIYLRDARGAVLAGPFPALGRAADVLAQRAGNPQRLRTRPGGDTPLGGYRLARYEAASGHPRYLDSFGPHGRIILAPVSGEAALAEAAGRFELALIGGRLGPFDRLRATDGAVRLHDRSLWTLQQAMRAYRVRIEILDYEDFDPALQGWDNNSLPPAHVDDSWDPAWSHPSTPPTGFAPDVGPELTGSWGSGSGEATAAAIGVAAGVAVAAEAGGTNAYDP